MEAQQQEQRGSSVKPARKPIKRKQLVSVRHGAAELAEDQVTGGGTLLQRAAVRRVSSDLAGSEAAEPTARRESRFAHDFSRVQTHSIAPATRPTIRPGMEVPRVRFHTGSQRALQIGAQAYADGRDVHFAPGQFRPNTAAGQQLIGHELAHVVQQQEGRVVPTARVEGMAINDDPGLEREADSWGRELGRIPWALWEAGPEGQRTEQSAASSVQRSGGVIQRTGPAFSTVGFTAGGHGPLNVFAQPSGERVVIESTPFGAGATVRVKGGTDEEVGDWEVGFGQTLRGQARFTASYTGSKRKWGFFVPTPKRDAVPRAREPWYDSQYGVGAAEFDKTPSTQSVRLWDMPEIPVPLKTPDGKGTLARTEGKTSFTTYLIARKYSAPNTIKYLNWAAWEVDYGATFRQEGKDGETVARRVSGATRGRGTGSGKGPHAPILRGQTANVAVKGSMGWWTEG